MDIENRRFTITEFQKKKIHNFVGSPLPTHAELLAGKQTVIPNDALIDLQEQGVRVDPDVIAVLMEVYGTQEILHPPSKETTLLYASLVTGALLSAGSGIAEAMRGSPDDAYTQWCISLGLYSSAYAMDLWSRGTHSERLEGFLRDHWPPIYSKQAYQDAYSRGYIVGRTEREKSAIIKMLELTSKRELAGDERPDFGLFMQMLHTEEILENAQKQFLYEYEMQTLIEIHKHMTGNNMDIIYRHFGIELCDFISLLVQEYKSGTYPLGYEFTSDDDEVDTGQSEEE